MVEDPVTSRRMRAGIAGPWATRTLLLLLSVCVTFMPGSLTAEEAGKTNIAILNFTPENAPSGEAAVITSFIRSAFVRNGRYTVVDKANMEKILTEQAFQQTGCTDQDCAVKLGKLLNVHKMIVGQYSVMAGVKFLTASLVDVETGKIERTGKVKGFDVLTADEAADQLVVQLSGPPVAPEEPRHPAKVASAEADPRIAGGRIGLGLNFPGAGLRWFVADRFAIEAKIQYEQTAMAAGPRVYVYVASLGGIFPYVGFEGDYGEYKDERVKSKGYAAAAYAGIEVYLQRQFSLQFDFGPVYVSLRDGTAPSQSIQSGGLGFMVNFGLTYYLGAGR